jgi:hypothetical protein
MNGFDYHRLQSVSSYYYDFDSCGWLRCVNGVASEYSAAPSKNGYTGAIYLYRPALCTVGLSTCYHSCISEGTNAVRSGR